MAQTLQSEADAFVERLVDAVDGAFLVFTVYIGDQLGYYETLVDEGALTSTALAEATDTDERYAREWLEQQTLAGVLSVDDPDASADERRYSLPEGHVEVLTDAESLNYLAPLAQVFVGAALPIRAVVEAFRTGEGVPFADYSPDLHEGQARINRPAFRHLLGAEWLPTMPDVDSRLREPGARVADIGCGFGHSCVGIADAYPEVHVDGYDLDAESVEAAREVVAEAGLADRVEIHRRDASDPDIEGAYDLVTAFECVHDMADPVGALATMRRLATPDGTVLVMDERVGETFAAPEDFDWMMYGWSVLHCLPVGRADTPSAATGTVMRTDTLRAYAEQAGFTSVEVLPIETEFFRFYRLEG
ncbi:SAM-dependent methyltransferase [Halorarius litoreus]|uniref:SAM-dependent methyltransferase n=1 Tax=Halorarius litoreus TaxID=2962676 RepID=UPI0020CE6492|nr:class I SAM-dependent methyltransferase [Halorarius litoreus]